MLKQILFILNTKYANVRVRWGRIHKIPHRFIGILQRVSYEKKSGFMFFILYKDITACHKIILKQMQHDYFTQIDILRGTNFKMKKQRQPLKMPITKTINVSHDMHFEINGTWIKYVYFLPSPVRKLHHNESKEWIMSHSSNNSCTQIDIPQFTSKKEKDILLDIDGFCMDEQAVKRQQKYHLLDVDVQGIL